MCKVIQFPVKHSTGYNNLVQLIPMSESALSVNFYLEVAENINNEGNFFPGEYDEIVELGRSERIKKAEPKEKEIEVDAPGAYVYCREMGEKKPKTDFTARHSHYGNHYFLETESDIELKGRGIKDLGWKSYIDGRKYREYQVTNKAYEKLKQEYSIGIENFLD